MFTQLKSYYREKLTYSKLRFSKFKKFASRSVFGVSNLGKYHFIFKLFVAAQKSEVWEKNCVWLIYCFNFERNHDVLKSSMLLDERKFKR